MTLTQNILKTLICGRTHGKHRHTDSIKGYVLLLYSGLRFQFPRSRVSCVQLFSIFLFLDYSCNTFSCGSHRSWIIVQNHSKGHSALVPSKLTRFIPPRLHQTLKIHFASLTPDTEMVVLYSRFKETAFIQRRMISDLLSSNP